MFAVDDSVALRLEAEHDRAIQTLLMESTMTVLLSRCASYRLSILLSLALLVSAANCGEEKLKMLDAKCQSLGVCSATEPVRPMVVDVLDDYSIGSTGTAEHLAAALDPALRLVGARSGRVRLWMLGTSGASLSPIGEQVAPSLIGRRNKQRARVVEEWITSAGRYFSVAAAPTFAAPPLKKSPLAEAISAIGLYDAGVPSAERLLIVLSDARETAVQNFECGALPTAGRWMAALDKKGALQADTLTGVAVRFAFFSMPTVAGCPTDLRRQRDVKALWDAAIRRSGGAVVFEAGPPSLGPAVRLGVSS